MGEVRFAHPRDFLELPCFNALHESLKSEGPGVQRKNLTLWMRSAMWLPRYYDPETGDVDMETLKEDFHELFREEYDWYKQSMTEYQIGYEYKQWLREPEDDKYLPVSCNSEDWQELCIGQSQCDYSLYQSPSYPQDMFDQLDSNSGASF